MAFVLFIVVFILVGIFSKDVMAVINGLFEIQADFCRLAAYIGGNYGKDLYDDLHKSWLCQDDYNPQSSVFFERTR